MWVLSPTRVWANVVVSPNAVPGPYHSTLISGFQVIDQPFGFQVIPAAAAASRPSLALPPVNVNPAQASIVAGATVSLSGSNLSASGTATGVTVTLNDQPANVLSASPTQVIFQVPAGTAAGPAQLKLNNGAADAFPIVIEIEAQ